MLLLIGVNHARNPDEIYLALASCPGAQDVNTGTGTGMPQTRLTRGS